MMSLAFITDIHGDVKALREALGQIEKAGCDLIVCGGDLVDLGAYPEESISLIRAKNIPCIRGNHDRWALEYGQKPVKQRIIDQPQPVSAEAMRFLSNLPASWSAKLEGVRVVVNHGTPRSDMDSIYPDLASGSDLRRWLDHAEADVLLVGHTHIAFTLSIPGRGMVANPGAILRDAGAGIGAPFVYDPASGTFISGHGPGGGTFGILELPSLCFTVHRAADGTEVEITRKTLF